MANPRQIRIPDDLWAAFGAAVKQQSPELDRSAMIRELIRWYVRGDIRHTVLTITKTG